MYTNWIEVKKPRGIKKFFIRAEEKLGRVMNYTKTDYEINSGRRKGAYFSLENEHGLISWFKYV